MHRSQRDTVVDAKYGTELEYVSQPAEAAHLPALRHALAAWAQRHGMSADQVDALTLAGYEALANAATHAYPDGGGTLDLRARLLTDRQQVEVTVTDRGRWRTPPANPGPTGGRGLPLIRDLAEHAEIEPGTDGTIVRMYWTLP